MSIPSHLLTQKPFHLLTQRQLARTIIPTTSSKGIAAIVGVGPKLGLSIAKKFAHEGYTVVILAQDFNRLTNLAEEIARHEKGCIVYAVRIDCSESKSVHQEAFQVVRSIGFVEILVYNACQLPLPWPSHPTKFTDICIDSFKQSLDVNTVSALHCAQQVIPGMVEKRKGTILFTGCISSINSWGYSSASSSTVGDEEEVIYRSGAEGLLDPDTLAQTYWQLHAQDPGVWTQEINLGSSSNN